MQLAIMYDLDPNDLTIVWAYYMCHLADLVTREIRDVATKILGDAGARLVDNMPPWISLYSHLQLIMESVEADHRAQGGNKAGTRRAPTKQLLYSGRYQRPELDRKGLCSQQAARVLRQRWEELAEIFDCVGDDAIATIHTKQFWAKTKRLERLPRCPRASRANTKANKRHHCGQRVRNLPGRAEEAMPCRARSERHWKERTTGILTRMYRPCWSCAKLKRIGSEKMSYAPSTWRQSTSSAKRLA